MTPYLIMVPIAYLVGSLPFGLILARLRGVDLRSYGSGATGTTNVMRTLGKPAGALVLLLDMGKGVFAIAMAMIFFDSPGAEAAAGVAALVGHNWPVFAGFKGGKGVATGWGGLILFSPWSGLVATLVGIPVILAWRYASLGSLLGTSAGVITLIVLASLGHLHIEYIWYGAVGEAIIIFRHRDNIQRLLKGEERRVGGKPTAAAAETGQEKGTRSPRSV
jgi:glycerol-3-phosphate acyltransferase PlsY